MTALDYTARVWCPTCPDRRLDTDETVVNDQRRYLALLWCDGCRRHYRLDVKLINNGGPLPIRLPWAPLAEAFPPSWRHLDDGQVLDGPNLTELADRLGTNTGRVYRWIRDGLPIPIADEIACLINSHPALIWPHEWAALHPDTATLETSAA